MTTESEIEIEYFDDEQIKEEFIKRNLSLETDLSEYEDYEIRAEYDDRGLSDGNLDNCSDDDIETEYENRGLANSQYSETQELVNEIIDDIHSNKIVNNRIIQLLKFVSGRVICKSVVLNLK